MNEEDALLLTLGKFPRRRILKHPSHPPGRVEGKTRRENVPQVTDEGLLGIQVKLPILRI